MIGNNENNNNKFIPKTYEQFVLEEQQTQLTKQNQAVADSYVAESGAYGSVGIQKGYGPCILSHDNCSITAILIDTNGNSRSETLHRPVELGEGGLFPWYGEIRNSWGIWTHESDFSIRGDNSFKPSYRTRCKLVEEIERIKKQCGHKTVSVTDKREWKTY